MISPASLSGTPGVVPPLMATGRLYFRRSSSASSSASTARVSRMMVNMTAYFFAVLRVGTFTRNDT